MQYETCSTKGGIRKFSNREDNTVMDSPSPLDDVTTKLKRPLSPLDGSAGLPLMVLPTATLYTIPCHVRSASSHTLSQSFSVPFSCSRVSCRLLLPGDRFWPFSTSIEGMLFDLGRIGFVYAVAVAAADRSIPRASVLPAPLSS